MLIEESNDIIQHIARQLLGAAERAGEDPLQFYRYIVRDEEKVFDKLDVKSLKDFAATLKTLRELAEEGEKALPTITVLLGEAEKYAE